MWEQFNESFDPPPAKHDSWEVFKKQFPDADLRMFKEVNGNIIFKPTGEVLYRKGDLQKEAVMNILTYKPWSEKYLLTNQQYPNPAVSFSERLKEDLTLKIRVSDESFVAKIRDIFKEVPVTHTTAKESHEWLSGPNMRYWPQQLNFAVWCASSGCGVGIDLMREPFFMFHFHFTVRRILYELRNVFPNKAMRHRQDA